MILFLRLGYGLVIRFGYVFNHWCIFFGILVYEFVGDAKNKVILCHPNFFPQQKWKHPRIPPENCNLLILQTSSWPQGGRPHERCLGWCLHPNAESWKRFLCFIHFFLVIFRGKKYSKPWRLNMDIPYTLNHNTVYYMAQFAWCLGYNIKYINPAFLHEFVDLLKVILLLPTMPLPSSHPVLLWRVEIPIDVSELLGEAPVEIYQKPTAKQKGVIWVSSLNWLQNFFPSTVTPHKKKKEEEPPYINQPLSFC